MRLPQTSKKIREISYDFFSVLSYYPLSNAVNCLLVAPRSLNLRGDCPKLLKRSMKHFLIFSIFSVINLLLTPLIACYLLQDH